MRFETKRSQTLGNLVEACVDDRGGQPMTARLSTYTATATSPTV